MPRLRAGENVLVIAHGNSLRALVMELENIAPADIANYEIATGEIKTYEFVSPDNGSAALQMPPLGFRLVPDPA